MSTPTVLEGFEQDPTLPAAPVKETAKSINDANVKAELARVESELKEVEAKITAALAVVPAVAPEVAPALAPVVDPTPAPLPEQRYEYQLTDESGRPMGGKQVIVYRTQEEFREKLIKNQEQAVRQMRKMSRDAQLGPAEVIPDDAEKFQNVVEFKSREDRKSTRL